MGTECDGRPESWGGDIGTQKSDPRQACLACSPHAAQDGLEWGPRQTCKALLLGGGRGATFY